MALADHLGKDDEVEFAGTVQTNADGQPVEKTTGTEMILDLIKPGNDVTITESSNFDKTEPNNAEDGQNGNGTNSSIRYNPNNKNDGGDGSTKIANEDNTFGAPAFLFLGHELIHAQEFKYGKNSYELTGEIDPDLNMRGMTESESRVRRIENKIRRENNIVPRKLPFKKD